MGGRWRWGGCAEVGGGGLGTGGRWSLLVISKSELYLYLYRVSSQISRKPTDCMGQRLKEQKVHIVL